MAADPEIREDLQEKHLKKQLASTVRKIQWSYAIFWSISNRQQGVLVWGDGYYNGDIKTRKTTQPVEPKADQMGLQRSEQLRELYESLSAGDSNQQTRRPSASLSPEDLTDTEWYYLVCMSFTFTLGQGLPGKAFVNNQHVWLSNAHLADSKIFSRSLLAKTLVCIPFMGGVLELGTTEAILEDTAWVKQITSFFWELPVPVFSEQSMSSNPEIAEDDQVILCPNLGYEINNAVVLKDQNFITDSQPPLETTATLFPFHSYAPAEQVEIEKVERLHSSNICQELKITSPGCSSNEFFPSQQFQDLFGMNGLNCMSPTQSRQFIDDEYVSMSFVNAQRVVPSINVEKTINQMLDDLQEGSQSKIESLELDGDDSHYAKTVAIILSNSKPVLPVSCFLKVSHKSNFMVWRRDLATPRPFVGMPQRFLKKILISREWFCSSCPTKLQEENRLQEKVWQHGDSAARHALLQKKTTEKLNEKFLVLQSIIPSISKVDKATILGDTIEYLGDLERRVQELESCWESAELDTKNTRKHPDVAERTSDNYGNKETENARKPPANKRKASDLIEAEAEHHWLLSKDGPIDVNVTMKEKELSVEMQCPWRECLLLEIIESISNFHLDPVSMQSSIADGVLALTIKSKFRSSTVASPGMIKRSLQRVIGKCL
ncbi:transcription factor EGL1-like [Canna indica]|uniref:Transcription factor EGL1-like n=1 Tax=Canna indica TaxID=4628 RepID=A0AAQ3KLX8_9LILI|nr:transcription factor EGL1-like [Canna indica]